VVVKELLARMATSRLAEGDGAHSAQGIPDPHPTAEQQLVDQEEVQRLLSSLQGAEADIVRMFHLEGKSYQEISVAVGVPENSIGPVLSRARSKMRSSRVDSAAR
jgi:RNA polymerase sigma-70 factor, ECF subfamily